MFSFVSAAWLSAKDDLAQNTSINLEKADALVIVKNYHAALAIYNQLISQSANKDVAQVYYKRSLVLLAQGSIEHAIQDAESACTHNLTEVTKLFNSNNNCRKTGNADFLQYQQHQQFAADILHYIVELKQQLIMTPQTLTAPASPLATQSLLGIKRRTKPNKGKSDCDKMVTNYMLRGN